MPSPSTPSRADTKGLDLFVEPSLENARRIVSALGEFGFGDVGLTVHDFSESGRIVQLGRAPSRIAIVTSIDGVSFQEVWAGRSSAKYGSVDADYIGREGLIRSKRASGRPQDLADLSWLDG